MKRWILAALVGCGGESFSSGSPDSAWTQDAAADAGEAGEAGSAGEAGEAGAAAEAGSDSAAPDEGGPDSGGCAQQPPTVWTCGSYAIHVPEQMCTIEEHALAACGSGGVAFGSENPATPPECRCAGLYTCACLLAFGVCPVNAYDGGSRTAAGCCVDPASHQPYLVCLE